MSGLYAHLVKPTLFQLPPETAHNLLCKGLALIEAYPAVQAVVSIATWGNPNPALSQTLWGHVFEHPLGLAAGFDKNARYVRALNALGFSYTEVGSLTAMPSPGNDKPRLFRLPDDTALINRMGLNNEGIQNASKRLSLKRTSHYGLNIAKTPGVYGEAGIQDMATALEHALSLPARYIALNMSCPNTQDGKSFEEPEAFARLLKQLRQVEASRGLPSQARAPWLVKLSCDVAPSVLSDLLVIGREYGLAGWILANTSTTRRGLKTSPKIIQACGQGGLSGLPIQSQTTALLGRVYQQTRAWERPPVLIGVGGILDAASAWEKITHGASLLQCYTGWVYQGPGFPKMITTGLGQKLKDHGYDSITEAIGSAIR